MGILGWIDEGGVGEIYGLEGKGGEVETELGVDGGACGGYGLVG